jgi:hypothetical protein
MLAICGLLAIMRQEWQQAVDQLEELSRLQGELTQPFTYVMLVRALRCNLEPARAREVVRQGLKAYPDQLELVADPLAFEDVADAVSSSVGTH